MRKTFEHYSLRKLWHYGDGPTSLQNLVSFATIFRATRDAAIIAVVFNAAFQTLYPPPSPLQDHKSPFDALLNMMLSVAQALPSLLQPVKLLHENFQLFQVPVRETIFQLFAQSVVNLHGIRKFYNYRTLELIKMSVRLFRIEKNVFFAYVRFFLHKLCDQKWLLIASQIAVHKCLNDSLAVLVLRGIAPEHVIAVFPRHHS